MKTSQISLYWPAWAAIIKYPQTGWLKQPKFIFSISILVLEKSMFKLPANSVSSEDFLLGLQMAASSLWVQEPFTQCMCSESELQSLFLFTSPIRLKLHPYDLI